MDFELYLREKAKEDGIKKLCTGAFIKRKDNSILVVKRKKDDFLGGLYEVPGGGVEIGETIIEGLIREVKEETNLDVMNILAYVSSFDYASKNGYNARQFNFVVEVDESKEIILTEHDSYDWVKPEDLPKENRVTKEVKDVLMIYTYNYTK